MSNNPRRRAVYVGLFVVVALAILGGGILTVGDLRDTFSRKVMVRAVFTEVNGLQTGNNVWYAGLKVGVVKHLRFLGVGQVEVEMLLDEEAAAFVHRDVLAKLGSDGLIGNRIVVLYAGSEEAAPVEEGDTLTVGTTTSTEEVLAMLQENNRNLLAITSDIKTITGSVAAGEGTLGRLLADDKLYEDLSGTASSLNAAASDAKGAVASLSTFAGELNRPGSLPHDLVTDTTTYPAFTGAVAELQTAATGASGLMTGLAEGVNDSASPLHTVLRDDEAGADLKATLDNLNTGTALLNEDLEALQHNFLLRRYFKKKEKEAAKAAAER